MLLHRTSGTCLKQNLYQHLTLVYGVCHIQRNMTFIVVIRLSADNPIQSLDYWETCCDSLQPINNSYYYSERHLHAKYFPWSKGYVVVYYLLLWLHLLKSKTCSTAFYVFFNICINTRPVNRFTCK